MKRLFPVLFPIFFILISANISAQSVIADFGKCKIIRQTASERERAMKKISDDISLTSESGKFRLHFSESGVDSLPFIDLNGNSISDYIDTALVEIDNIYKEEVTDLDLSFPNLQTVDIYFTAIGDDYGQTTIESDCTYPYTGKSDILINNFINLFFSKGMDMIRVTLAHEFHHVLQFQKGAWFGKECISGGFTNYDFLFYYESSAVFYEEAVYNSINDYYNYIKYSNNTGKLVFEEPNSPSLYKNTSTYMYSAGVFFIFIRDHFGLQKAKEYEKRILELLPDFSPCVAMSKACNEVLNIPIYDLFHDYSVAVSLTRNYEIEGHSFSESDQYPLLKKQGNQIQVSQLGTVSIAIPLSPTGFGVYWFIYKNKEFPFVVSNGNFERYNDEGLSVADDTIRAFIDLNNYHVDMSLPKLSLMKTVRASLIDTSSKLIYKFTANSISDQDDVDPFPNPIVLSKSEVINLAVKGTSDTQQIDLQIIDVTGKVMVKKNLYGITGLKFIDVNLSNSKIASGVYFYFFTSNDTILNSGKFAVIK